MIGLNTDEFAMTGPLGSGSTSTRSVSVLTTWFGEKFKRGTGADLQAIGGHDVFRDFRVGLAPIFCPEGPNTSPPFDGASERKSRPLKDNGRQ
jgi:hypothetical protein